MLVASGERRQRREQDSADELPLNGHLAVYRSPNSSVSDAYRCGVGEVDWRGGGLKMIRIPTKSRPIAEHDIVV
jgi:hypothetical protein